MPCVYCLKEPVSVSICIECRTKLELAQERVSAAEKAAAAWRRGYYQLLREKENRRRRDR